jgi:hypothetical protein
MLEEIENSTGYFRYLTLSVVELIPDEVWRRYSPVVKLSFELKPVLSTAKTSLNPTVVKLIESETVILKTLNHPLLLGIENPFIIQ